MRHRLPVALIAAASSVVALATPAVAEEESPLSSGSSSASQISECFAEGAEEGSKPDKEKAEKQDKEDAAPADSADSELSSSLSSRNKMRSILGMPTTVDEDELGFDLDCMPEWYQTSVNPPEELRVAMGVIGSIAKVAAVSSQVIVALAPVIGEDRIRAAAEQLGYQADQIRTTLDQLSFQANQQIRAAAEQLGIKL